MGSTSTLVIVLISTLVTIVFTEDTLMQDVARLCSKFCPVRPEKECKKELPEPDIYAPMDRIDGVKSAATGADVTVRGYPRPSIVPGKYGGAIYTANEGTIDDKYINLGNQRGRCIDNLAKCKNGLTVSIWYWLSNGNHLWPTLVSTTEWQLPTYNMPGNKNEPYFLFFKEPGKLYIVGGVNNSSFTNEEWHHVAFVYRSNEDIRLFVDGELNAASNRYHKDWLKVEKIMQVGCHLDGNCVRAKFDELKIWEQALSDEDIKTIYNQKTASP